MDLREYTRQQALAAGVRPELIINQFGVESAWNPNAVSPKNARGIAQFIPETGARYGLHAPEDFMNPYKSIDAGIAHMSDLLADNGGDERLALAAYNAGQGAVNKYGGIPPYKETQNYVKKIMGGRSEPQAQAQEPKMNYQNPVTASAVQSAMQPQQPQQQHQQQQGPAFNDPMFWLQAAGAMNPNQAPMAALSQGLGAASSAYQRRTQMTPYERAKIDQFREEAAMRQGISPYQQAQLGLEKQKIAANERARNEMNPYQKEQVRIADEVRAAEADRRARAIDSVSNAVGGRNQAEYLVDNAPTLAAKLMIGPGGAPPTTADVDSMRKEFMGLPEVKDYKSVQSGYDAMDGILNLENNAVASPMAIVQLFKIFDPTSTVTATEGNQITGATGPWQAMQSEFNKALGQGRMTDSVRKQIGDLAYAALQGRHNRASRTQDMFNKIAGSRGMPDLYQVTGDKFTIPEPSNYGAAATADEPDSGLPEGWIIRSGR